MTKEKLPGRRGLINAGIGGGRDYVTVGKLRGSLHRGKQNGLGATSQFAVSMPTDSLEIGGLSWGDMENGAKEVLKSPWEDVMRRSIRGSGCFHAVTG
jgi:hypothetical protein